MIYARSSTGTPGQLGLVPSQSFRVGLVWVSAMASRIGSGGVAALALRLGLGLDMA